MGRIFYLIRYYVAMRQSFRSRSLFIAFLLLIVQLPSRLATAQAAPQVCPAQLGDRVSAIVNRPEFARLRWGILIQTQSPDPPTTLAAHDAERYFIPASNAKLLTTAAALTQLGSEFRIRTSIYQVDATASGVVLAIVGRGDPSVTDAELRQLAQQLSDRGITTIDQLIADDHYIRGETANSTWEWEDIQAGYGAPASSLMLNQNRINLTLVPQAVGQPLRVEWETPTAGRGWQIDNQSQTVEATAPEFLQVGRDLTRPVLVVRGQLRVNAAPEPVAVAVTQPSQNFLDRFRQILTAQQIRVHQVAIAPTAVSANLPEVAAIESPALASLIQVANQRSNNIYAEAILRSLGATNPDATSHLDAGLAALNLALTRLNISPDSYHLVDGSGLSRRDLVSPVALVQTLQAMARSPYATVFRDSLAKAGESGTLRNSFRNTPIQGRLRGKTGSLTGVTTLSGYFDPAHYSPLVFSILVNQANTAIDDATNAIDEILLLMAQLQDC